MLTIIESVTPWLVVKQEQALLAKSFQAHMLSSTHPGAIGYSVEIIALRQSFWEGMRKLNRKGVPSFLPI